MTEQEITTMKAAIEAQLTDYSVEIEAFRQFMSAYRQRQSGFRCKRSERQPEAVAC